jgi:hypothetical protein
MQAHTFDCFSEDLGLGRHDFAKHSFALILTAEQPPTDCTIIEELMGVGPRFPVTLEWTRAGAKSSLKAPPMLIKAEAEIGPFAYAAIANTSSGRALACFETGEQTLKAGESLEVRFPSVIVTVG